MQHWSGWSLEASNWGGGARPKVNTKPKGTPNRGNSRARSLKHEQVWCDAPETNRGPHGWGKVIKGNRKMRSSDARAPKPRKELDFTRRI